MNLHASIDDLTVGVASVMLGDRRFFADSLESPPLVDAAAGAEAGISGIERETGEGSDPGPIQTVDVETQMGEYRAWYRVEKWVGTDYPAVIFHHGSGEDPFASGPLGVSSVQRIFDDSDEIPANVLVVRAPYHDRSARAYIGEMGALADFVGMLAASTAVVEGLVDDLHESGTPAVVISGISLGGWVTNLHRAVHGTAERYAPIFAGDRLAEVFASSAYRRVTAAEARDQPDRLRAVLDFEDAFEDAEAQVKGLLARHDRIVEFDVQKEAYGPEELVTMNEGHVTGALAAGWHRIHIEKALREAPAYTG